jgi:hypothetical protein
LLENRDYLHHSAVETILLPPKTWYLSVMPKAQLTQCISIQKDAKGRPVPVEPALATASRFGRLANVKADA